MFTIKQYLSAPYTPELYTVKIRNEEFLIRRLNGIESVKIETVQGESRILFVLSDCLYDGSTRKPIGPINAEEFLKQYGGFAFDVFLKILNDTSEYEKAERAKLEEEEKNSESIDTQSSTGNIAKDSGSTPKEQKSVKTS